MSNIDLNAVINEPGFGGGERVRDVLAASASAKEALPDPKKIPPVMADKSSSKNWLIASFGYDEETDSDWHLTTVDVRASDTPDLDLMAGAKHDAEAIAAIVNAYRLGILVVAQ